MRAVRHTLIAFVALLFMVGGSTFATSAVVPTSTRIDGNPAPAPDSTTTTTKTTTTPTTAAKPPAQATTPATCPTEHRGAFPTPPPPADISQKYYLNDWRLGPAKLPEKPPLGPFLLGYERTDDLTAPAFLSCYWNDTIKGWWYPDNDGFLLNAAGQPIKTSFTIQPGQFVDLFGTGTGHFLSPAGAPYAVRAIPPSNLNTLDECYPYGYHLYKVLEPITVEAGPIRPWFGQPGLGLQYKLSERVSELVARQALEPLN
jgi:nicrotizing toxin Mtb-like protein